MNISKTNNSIMSESNAIKPALYLVPTPIGNLEDITLRALRLISGVDIVACEDTRQTGKLLKLLDIRAKSIESYHDYNESTKSEYLISKILEGKSIALVSDAGSPAISDPGYRLVQAAIRSEVDVVALPGATAFVPALAASGMAVHEFAFLGFPPQKKGRQTFLRRISRLEMTVIMYESPYRVGKLVVELIEICGGERKICLAREISKMYEEYIRGSLFDVKKIIEERNNLKGEFVVILEGFSESKIDLEIIKSE